MEPTKPRPLPWTSGPKDAKAYRNASVDDPLMHKAMMRAARSGNAKAFGKLLAAGADPAPLLSPSLDGFGMPCVLLTMAQSNFSGVAMIFRAIGRFDRRRMLLSTLLRAGQRSSLDDLLDLASMAPSLFIERQAVLSCINSIAPSWQGNDKVFAALLSLVDPATELLSLGTTLLMAAVRLVSDPDPLGIIPRLIPASDLHAKDLRGLTALDIAAQATKANLCRALARSGADIDRAIALAQSSKKTAIVQALLDGFAQREADQIDKASSPAPARAESASL